MNTKHEKSPCCRGVIRRFGGRRRQCGSCGRTWSVWKKKRGRKHLRVREVLIHRYLSHEVPPLRKQRLMGYTEAQLKYRLQQSREQTVRKRTWPEPPLGPLIVIADAMVRHINKSLHTWYFILVRSPRSNRAVILAPYAAQGTETVQGWRQAFDRLDSDIRHRIIALVCDGHRGLVFEAKWRRWMLQRCHFHLIARIQGRRSRWHTSRHREEGRMIFQLVQEALTTRDSIRLDKALNTLEEMGWTVTSPELRKVLLGFVNHVEDYRTYLYHPELHLPVTNNAVEAFISLIAELSSRTRGFRTARSLHEWISVLIKTRRSITCNGKTIQQN